LQEKNSEGGSSGTRKRRLRQRNTARKRATRRDSRQECVEGGTSNKERGTSPKSEQPRRARLR